MQTRSQSKEVTEEFITEEGMNQALTGLKQSLVEEMTIQLKELLSQLVPQAESVIVNQSRPPSTGPTELMNGMPNVDNSINVLHVEI